MHAQPCKTFMSNTWGTIIPETREMRTPNYTFCPGPKPLLFAPVPVETQCPPQKNIPHRRLQSGQKLLSQGRVHLPLSKYLVCMGPWTEWAPRTKAERGAPKLV